MNDMTTLAKELREAAALEGTWYADVGRKTAARICDLMRRAAYALEPAAEGEIVTASAIKRILLDTLEVQVRPNDPKDVPGISDDSLNAASLAIRAMPWRRAPAVPVVTEEMVELACGELRVAKAPNLAKEKDTVRRILTAALGSRDNG